MNLGVDRFNAGSLEIKSNITIKNCNINIKGISEIRKYLSYL